MKELKHGAVSVVLPENVELSLRAGKMSKREVSRLLKAPVGMRYAAEHSALALTQAGESFAAPVGITPELLKAFCNGESEVLERIIVDLLHLLLKFKQGKLLVDAKLHHVLRQLKDSVRAQAKYTPQLLLMFAPLLALFEKSKETRKKRVAEKRKAERERAEELNEVQKIKEKPSLNLVKVPDSAS
jgi:hypothetical protein